MNPIREYLRQLWRVEYRLTYYTKGEAHHIYSDNASNLRYRAEGLGATIWSIYKRGPVGLPERLIDSNE